MLARHKRDHAAFARRVAATLTLIRDKESLLAQAAAMEKEAEQLEQEAEH